MSHFQEWPTWKHTQGNKPLTYIYAKCCPSDHERYTFEGHKVAQS